MHLSTVVTTLFASAAFVSAHGSLGLCLGVKRNSDGQCKTTADFASEFDILSQHTNIVRIYAASDCNSLQNIAPALEAKNFKLYLGVWPTGPDHFAAEKQALQNHLPTISKDKILGITVGSEALYRKDMTAEELASAINDVKTLIAGIKDKNGESYSSVPVGSADSWNIWVDGANTAAIQASDIILSNAFSYWQGQTMQNASYSFSDDIMQALQRVQLIKGTDDVNFWVGETGWPTEGDNFGASQPSVPNAERFWKEGICAIRAWGINTFVFEAFDESWKPATSGKHGVEQHWGILKDDGQPKYDLSCGW